MLSQTVKDIKILVHDDGSKDGTREIIDRYVALFPNRIYRIEAEPTGSACKNFAFLLSKCNTEYIMFCDQDDVWNENKVELTLKAMNEAEQQYGADTPILVHSDLSVVNENLEVVDDSFFHFQGLDASKVSLPHLLVQNYVTGCTMMINKPLHDIAGEIPGECAMHDWWLALVAALFGQIVFVNRPLMLYRQHSGNEVGAKSSHGISYIVRKIRSLGEVQSNYMKTYIQARLLRQRFSGKLTHKNQKILNAYCNMSEVGKIGRIRIMRQYDFKKSTTLRVIGQYFLI